jgi:hypothetical protein
VRDVAGKVTTSCDVFAFGVMCLEMLTSRQANDDTLEPPSVVHAFEEADEEGTVGGLLDSRPEVGWTDDAAGGLIGLAKGCLRARGARRPSTAAVAAGIQRLTVNGQKSV